MWMQESVLEHQCVMTGNIQFTKDTKICRSKRADTESTQIQTGDVHEKVDPVYYNREWWPGGN